MTTNESLVEKRKEQREKFCPLINDNCNTRCVCLMEEVTHGSVYVYCNNTMIAGISYVRGV